MTTRRKPQKKIKFQLTRSGIAGIGVVCFCIFLWMFLLGVWTGQSMVLPSLTPTKTMARNTVPKKKVPHIEATTTKKIYKKSGDSQ